MQFCHFCNKIKEIRVKQGRDYYKDLCKPCQQKERILRLNREKEKELVYK